jgi:hypothetical protein
VKKQKRLNEKLEDNFNILTREVVMEEERNNLQKNLKVILRKTGGEMGLDLKKEVRVIGDVRLNGKEKMFVAMGKKMLGSETRVGRRRKVTMDVEDMLYSEKKDKDKQNIKKEDNTNSGKNQ